MTARCHTDSCSIAWSEVEAGGGLTYQADAQLDPSMQCGGVAGAIAYGTGFGVHKSPDAGNLLQLRGDGVWIGIGAGGIPGAEILADSGDNWVDMPRTATSANPLAPQELVFVNPLGINAVALVSGKMSFFYGIVDDLDVATIGGLTPFNAQFQVRIKAALAAIPATAPAPGTSTVAHYIPVGGMAPTTGGPPAREEQGIEPVFSFPFPVPAGGSLHIRAFANHQGAAQTTNITLEGTSAGGQKRGFNLRDITATFVLAP